MNLDKKELIEAIENKEIISGLTHNYYPYPARFPPSIPKHFIKEFNGKIKTVLDSYSGGGTTLVEASISGKKSYGIDLNPLATFLSEVKTTPLSINKLIYEYKKIFEQFVNTRLKEDKTLFGKNDLLMINEKVRKEISTLNKIISQSKSSEDIRNFFKCVLISTCSVLSSRKELEKNSIKSIFYLKARNMIDGMKEYNEKFKTKPIIFNDDAQNTNKLIKDKIDLLITSPPYFEIHIEYSNLMLSGRRGSKLPYKIIGIEDIKSSSDYVMKKGQVYFDLMEKNLQSINDVLVNGAYCVYVIGFKQRQKAYKFVKLCKNNKLKLLKKYTRNVPHRKWYTKLRGKNSIPKEYVFIFQKKR